MSQILSALRLLVLAVSCYGYIQTVSKKIKVEFSIGITFVSIGTAMFLAGILNILPEAAMVICLLGVYLAVRSVLRRDEVRHLLSAGTVFFAVSCVYFFFLLHHSLFIHDDNFSHWAIAAKSILENDRFPNYSDINILFQSYPLGYASFIYYIVKIVGIPTEWMQMYAQAILMSGICAGLFAFAKSWPQRILTAAGCVMLLAGNMNFVELLVDTLLPITALGAVAFCMYYREELWEKSWWVMPYTVFLITVKNSGIFFTLVILVYLLTKVRNPKEGKLWLVNALCPFGVLLLWQKHVKLVFDDGMMTFHSVSLEYFQKMFEKKGTEDIQTILSAFVQKMFSFSNEVLFACILLAALLAVMCRAGKPYRREVRELALLAGLSYLTYQAMMLGMYLFTMPVNEATRLAEYFRYHDTILIFVSGLLLLGAVRALEAIPGRKLWQQAAGIVLCVLMVFYTVSPSFDSYRKQVLTENIRGVYRMEYDALIEEYDIPSQSRYLLLVDSDCTFRTFLKYLSRYLLDPTGIDVQYTVDLTAADEILNNYDYLIAFDDTEEVMSYIAENFPGEAGQRVIRLPGE
ncbi:MAG: hypothetical protein IJ001_06885 [Oscillospiraceae bacterium]|nr:hypothetical protein [Oscillospiraceae bacterium]